VDAQSERGCGDGRRQLEQRRGPHLVGAAAGVDPTAGVLWACWYDTTFDPNAHRVWFTCSASRDGRAWSAPERAAAVPPLTADVFSAVAAGGLYSALAARGGVAHAFWIDGRVVDLEQEVFTAALPERAALSR
jgi:hypothetical protein